jgi:serine/threonine protein kinase
VRCGLLTSDHDVWCQERGCSLDEASIILNYGDQIAGIKVIRLLYLLRTAAIYEAQRGEQKIILKVAHQGCEEQLQKEAHLLNKLRQYPPERIHQRWLNRLGLRKIHPALPILLPAYPEASIAQHPFGKGVFREQEKYFEVFRYDEKFYFAGKLLRDWLLEDVQPWYKNAVWLTLGIADVVGLLNAKAKVIHANLHPDVVLVRVDKKGVFRPLLLDLGKMISEVSLEDDIKWLHRYGAVNYLAPELTYITRQDREFGINRVDVPMPQTDVYGLGTLLYEMMMGYPVFEIDAFKPREEQVRRRVITKPPDDVTRNDFVETTVSRGGMNQFFKKALSKNPQERFRNVKEFAELLRRTFGNIPKPKRGFKEWSRITFFTVFIGVLVGLLFIILTTPAS